MRTNKNAAVLCRTVVALIPAAAKPLDYQKQVQFYDYAYACTLGERDCVHLQLDTLEIHTINCNKVNHHAIMNELRFKGRGAYSMYIH